MKDLEKKYQEMNKYDEDFYIGNEDSERLYLFSDEENDYENDGKCEELESGIVKISSNAKEFIEEYDDTIPAPRFIKENKDGNLRIIMEDLI